MVLLVRGLRPNDLANRGMNNLKFRNFRSIIKGKFNMSTYDIIMLVLVFAAIAFGAWKGLAWQIASFASIVISYFMALSFSTPLAAMLQIEAPWNRIVAMLGIFLGTSLAVWIVFGRIKHLLKAWNLGAFDRQAGALLGAFKGAVICMVVTMFAVSLLGETAAKAICESRTGGYIIQGIDQVAAVVPKEFNEILQPRLEAFRSGVAHEGHDHEGGVINKQSLGFGGGDSDANALPSFSDGSGNQMFSEFTGLFQSNSSNKDHQSVTGQWGLPGGSNGGASSNSQSGTDLFGGVLDNVFDSAKSQFKQSTENTANRFFNGQSQRK